MSPPELERPSPPPRARPTKRQHSERWAQALNEAGVPVCWVCDTRNAPEAHECTRCGQRLVSRPNADSSSLEAIPTASAQWGAIHTVCVAAVVLLASGFLLLI